MVVFACGLFLDVSCGVMWFSLLFSPPLYLTFKDFVNLIQVFHLISEFGCVPYAISSHKSDPQRISTISDWELPKLLKWPWWVGGCLNDCIPPKRYSKGVCQRLTIRRQWLILDSTVVSVLFQPVNAMKSWKLTNQGLPWHSRIPIQLCSCKFSVLPLGWCACALHPSWSVG